MRNEWDDKSDEPGPGLTASWAAVLRDVRSLAVDLTTAGTEMARQVPVPPLEQLVSGWGRVEDAMLRELKARLDHLDDPAYRPEPTPGAHPSTPARLLDNLLTASIDADSAQSREALYTSLLLRMVPDEARILAALADGTRYPLVHIKTRGNGGRTVLANASTVGRAAGVQVPEVVPTYVGHLRALGLADEGPADESLSVQYDILLGEPAVRHADEQAHDVGRLGTRVVRRTLRISPLGRALWRACRPDDETEAGLHPSDSDLLDGVTPLPHHTPDTIYRPENGSHPAGPTGGPP
ncbi:Abi-alpha family protein [Pseudonocardia acaciae]|uniref:Abi-alpha family protein n=1 Tax=Pseudonocardia acaciae TaxID=551276 RepID=UPI000AFA7556|nr:Abi-alpha family protein [Pseudonocardia acaciae]